MRKTPHAFIASRRRFLPSLIALRVDVLAYEISVGLPQTYSFSQLVYEPFLDFRVTIPSDRKMERGLDPIAMTLFFECLIYDSHEPDRQILGGFKVTTHLSLHLVDIA